MRRPFETVVRDRLPRSDGGSRRVGALRYDALAAALRVRPASQTGGSRKTKRSDRARDDDGFADRTVRPCSRRATVSLARAVSGSKSSTYPSRKRFARSPGSPYIAATVGRSDVRRLVSIANDRSDRQTAVAKEENRCHSCPTAVTVDERMNAQHLGMIDSGELKCQREPLPRIVDGANVGQVAPDRVDELLDERTHVLGSRTRSATEKGFGASEYPRCVRKNGPKTSRCRPTRNDAFQSRTPRTRRAWTLVTRNSLPSMMRRSFCGTTSGRNANAP